MQKYLIATVSGLSQNMNNLLHYLWLRIPKELKRCKAPISHWNCHYSQMKIDWKGYLEFWRDSTIYATSKVMANIFKYGFTSMGTVTTQQLPYENKAIYLGTWLWI